MFKKFFSRTETALTGAPPVRRLKTYSAQSGYVYQYYYEGYRRSPPSGESGTEFVFTISADRKSWRPSSVLVGDAVVAAWRDGRHGGRSRFVLGPHQAGRLGGAPRHTEQATETFGGDPLGFPDGDGEPLGGAVLGRELAEGRRRQLIRR